MVLIENKEKAFVVGADINEMADLDLVGMNKMNQISWAVFTQTKISTKPVIAALNVLALGGGLEPALACDLRISLDRIKFAFPEVGLGTIPGGGGTQRLQKIVGQGVAKELLYFSEKLGAKRALELHIENRVVPGSGVLGTVKEWAMRLAQKPPTALQMLKLAVNFGGNTNLESGLKIESICFGNAFSTEDRKEGLDAFIDKRKPVYKGW